MELWPKFIELTEGHFAFLERDYQFERKDTKPPFVIYVSNKLQIRIYYKEVGNWPYELDLGISTLSDDPRKFPPIHIPELIMLSADWSEAEKYISPFPKALEELDIEIPKLAQLLKKYGSRILEAEPEAFAKIQRLREEKIREINEQAKTRLI